MGFHVVGNCLSDQEHAAIEIVIGIKVTTVVLKKWLRAKGTSRVDQRVDMAIDFTDRFDKAVDLCVIIEVDGHGFDLA